MNLERFVKRWEPSAAAEHSNAQTFLNEPCEVLEVDKPQPATGDPDRDRYVFEKPVILTKEENASTGHVDLYKDGHFILEAKQGLVSVLRGLHDDLDAATLDAYGWPKDISDEGVLERLVTLNSQRAEEEARGIVRWVRPDIQNPKGTRQAAAQVPLIEDEVTGAEGGTPTVLAWPKKLFERIAAVRGVLAQGASWTVPEVARMFKGAKRADVEEVLTGLAALGLAVSFEVDGVRRWRAPGRAAA
jgi:hypothetical protein